MWQHVLISTARVFGVFLLAFAVGIPLGLAMRISPLIRGFFDPPIALCRPIPPLVYLPPMIIRPGLLLADFLMPAGDKAA